MRMSLVTSFLLILSLFVGACAGRQARVRTMPALVAATPVATVEAAPTSPSAKATGDEPAVEESSPAPRSSQSEVGFEEQRDAEVARMIKENDADIRATEKILARNHGPKILKAGDPLVAAAVQMDDWHARRNALNRQFSKEFSALLAKFQRMAAELDAQDRASRQDALAQGEQVGREADAPSIDIDDEASLASGTYKPLPDSAKPKPPDKEAAHVASGEPVRWPDHENAAALATLSRLIQGFCLVLCGLAFLGFLGSLYLSRGSRPWPSIEETKMHDPTSDDSLDSGWFENDTATVSEGASGPPMSTPALSPAVAAPAAQIASAPVAVMTPAVAAPPVPLPVPAIAASVAVSPPMLAMAASGGSSSPIPICAASVAVPAPVPAAVPAASAVIVAPQAPPPVPMSMAPAVPRPPALPPPIPAAAKSARPKPMLTLVPAPAPDPPPFLASGSDRKLPKFDLSDVCGETDSAAPPPQPPDPVGVLPSIILEDDLAPSA